MGNFWWVTHDCFHTIKHSYLEDVSSVLTSFWVYNRIDFLKNHLRYIHKGIEEGSNIRGYNMWMCMDNWSWMNAYKNRYGFIAVDLNDNRKRTIKKSGYWFNDVAHNNGFND